MPHGASFHHRSTHHKMSTFTPAVSTGTSTTSTTSTATTDVDIAVDGDTVSTTTTAPSSSSQQQLLLPPTSSSSSASLSLSSLQPVSSSSSSSPSSSGIVYPEGPIVPNKLPTELRAEPYTMPHGFVWSNIDMTHSSDVQELYHLLSNNYVEDDDALFRFDYSAEFLSWALQPPNYNPEFIFGVRSVSNTTTTNNNNNNNHNHNHSKLVAFISGIPTTLQIHDHTVPVVEINFLCIHKKLRSKRLAPVLIKEMTRRVNWTGIYQAVYTAGTILPVPVASARYYHRNLNPKKLVQVGFSRIGHRMTMARMMKLYKLPEQITTPNLRPMVEQDVASVHTLLNQYLSKFSMKVCFTVEEIRHWLLPRPNVINSYVIGPPPPSDDDDNDHDHDHPEHRVTDLISFYHLPSSILHQPHDTKLYAAYSYYNVATSVPLHVLMKEALILAQREGHCDVYNALNLMDNAEFLEDLKFGLGDGTLQYYIYNWACPNTIPSQQLGIVLL
jgi:glycylpeptide N-tetradecanoyltransferase